MMVEVFQTNVTTATLAHELLDDLHARFPGYEANFDLEDCDNILRIASVHGKVDAREVIRWLAENGFMAQVLPDEPYPIFSDQQPSNFIHENG